MNLFELIFRITHYRNPDMWIETDGTFTGKSEVAIIRTRLGPRRADYSAYEIVYYANGKRLRGWYSFHPLPPNPWQDILKADKGSPNPIQVPGGFHIGNNSLDCLYLNVFVPEGCSGSVPVMVWIYGGSYSQGGAGAMEKDSRRLQYDLSYFARETGCIIVTFNYRLNLYGFLNLHFLEKSFDRNNGLFDQIMALRFVKENIKAFGGDPENITLFGQSAGGACILALMTMKDAEGLFHKSIVQSACIKHFFTEEESEKNTKKYLRYAGIYTASELKAGWVAATPVSCLCCLELTCRDWETALMG